MTSLLFPSRFRWMCWQTWVTRSLKRSASTLMVTDTNSSRASRGCWGASKVRKHRDTHTHTHERLHNCCFRFTRELTGRGKCRERLHQMNHIKSQINIQSATEMFEQLSVLSFFSFFDSSCPDSYSFKMRVCRCKPISDVPLLQSGHRADRPGTGRQGVPVC